MLAARMLALLALAVLPTGAAAGVHGGLKRDRGSTSRAHAAIVGGHLARNGQFPWVARMFARHGRLVDACSGTVVAADLVLTAAHCVEDVQTGVLRPASELEVQTAAYGAGQMTSRSSRVSRVLVYPGFEASSGVGDAALLELSTPTNAPPIQLASEPGQWRAGTPALMTGWGRTGEAPRATQLHWASTVVQSPEWCAARLRDFHTRRQLCAINTPGDNTAGCAGDSGGPLLVQRGSEIIEIGVLNGSVVGGSRLVTCLTSEPTVFANSTVISGWVGEWIQRLNTVPVAVTEGAR